MAEPKPYPIIDSHIHLYPSSEISQLAWNTDSSSPLHAQHSIAEYNLATSTPKNLEGFIFLETDRKNDLEAGESGWEYPLREIDFLKRIIEDEPRDGEGHAKGDGQKCLGIVPWAPLPQGEEAMKRYVEVGKKRIGEKVWGRVKGFRYLVQDKPRGTLLGEGFLEALRWMGREGYVFDLGVDQHRGGKWQLEEALECIGRAREGVKEGDGVKVVVNHLLKPNLSIYTTTDPSFITWRNTITQLAKLPDVYMKLSGCFSEMPDSLKNAPILDICIALQPYLAVVLGAFGAERIMFGSDWPVCTVGVNDDGDGGWKGEGEGGSGAWVKWKKVVEKFCWLCSLGDEEQIWIWSGTAIKAYGIRELM